MIVGFTGTREGMSDRQAQALFYVLSGMLPSEVHHGDCVGADAEAFEMAKRLGITTVAHPPLAAIHRAHTESDRMWAPAEYLVRDRDIVHAIDLLIGAPLGAPKGLRSGTWYTVRYADQMRVPTILLDRGISGDVTMSG